MFEKNHSPNLKPVHSTLRHPTTMSHTDLATQTSTLGDRSHHKRELAALLIEMTVRQIMTSEVEPANSHSSHMHHRNHREQLAREMIARRTDQIQLVIEFLLTHFIAHDQPNYRKGGLLGIAHVMMALTTKRNTLTYEGINFLNVVIPIIQKCLDDEDSHVRYHACEALFNVINVARSHIIRFFDLIFSHIQKVTFTTQFSFVIILALRFSFRLFVFVCVFFFFFFFECCRLVRKTKMNERLQTLHKIYATV